MEVRLSLKNNFDSSASGSLSSHSRMKSPYAHPASEKMRKTASKNTTLKHKNKNNCENINRPTESVSFSGSAVSKTSGLLDKMAKYIVTNEHYHKLVNFSEKNEAKLKAAFSLILAGILKPLCVVAMPGAEEDDKKFTATKNAVSAFIGYGLTCAILDPISLGVDKFIKHPEEYLGKDNALVKEFTKDKAEQFKIRSKEELKNMKYKANTLNTFKTVYKNGLGILVAPAKAALTIALVPYVLKFLFGDKKQDKPKEQPPLYMEPLLNPVMLNSISSNNNVFAAFSQGGQK